MNFGNRIYLSTNPSAIITKTPLLQDRAWEAVQDLGYDHPKFGLAYLKAYCPGGRQNPMPRSKPLISCPSLPLTFVAPPVCCSQSSPIPLRRVTAAETTRWRWKPTRSWNKSTDSCKTSSEPNSWTSGSRTTGSPPLGYRLRRIISAMPTCPVNACSSLKMEEFRSFCNWARRVGKSFDLLLG